MNLSKYKTLGVINRTPNSFSDHGASLDPHHFNSQLKSFLADPSVIVDIGFESTAPMNQAISESEEYSRFLSFLEASKEYCFADKFISFDTYKVKNFLLMTREFQKIHPQAHFIFNDVSGVLDSELQQALQSFKEKNFYYIYTFSHIPDRSHVLDHMKYVHPEINIVEASINAFNKAIDWFKTFGMESQLILDPGLGFSKSYEQNWQLIEQFAELEEKLAQSNPILLGLSKKSFLKKALDSYPGMGLEALHKKCIKDLQRASKRPILFRVHDPEIMKS